jgi:tRNA pseudouridine55 synthase
LTDTPLHGVVIVDKPAGPTSHDMVDRVRRALRERRVGHTGTLDPFATGVLVMCVGKATRLARFLAEGEKVYRATVRLGYATTTDDLTGEPLAAPCPVDLGRTAIEEAALSLTGPLRQRPPAYSAKRRAGKRMYELARAGEPAPSVIADVHVHAFTVLSLREPEVDVEVRCSPGTYVRALARDLGEALGVGGHLTSLRRLCSGSFCVDSAVSAEQLDTEALRRLVPISSLLPEWPSLRLSEAESESVRKGRPLEPPTGDGTATLAPGTRLRLVDASDNLVGLALVKDEGGHWVKNGYSNDVDAVIDNVMDDSEEAASQSQEPHGGEP